MKQPFKPNQLPITISDIDKIALLRIETDARVKIQKYNSLLERSPIKDEIFVIFSIDESLQSTKIEGTQATFDQVVSSEVTGNRNTDVQEVYNYLEALLTGERLLKTLPICTKLILQLHKIILNNARGANRNPGSYRKTQNFIGPTNKIEDATYIPPEAHLLSEYMSNLEKYINEDNDNENLGYLAKAAIVHGQFETIHPFLDGNGRIGRILIILYLLDKKVIERPTFFISQELEKNKFKYYTLLNGLRNDNPKWVDWIKFFLNSSIKQADYYIDKLERIESLYKELLQLAEKDKIRMDMIKYIFRDPVFSIKKVKENLGISDNTVRNNLNKLIEAGKIYPDDKKRNTIYRFYDLLDIIQ